MLDVAEIDVRLWPENETGGGKDPRSLIMDAVGGRPRYRTIPHSLLSWIGEDKCPRMTSAFLLIPGCLGSDGTEYTLIYCTAK